MKFGSLFSGIGGMDLGLERAGMSCAWQVEIDEYATRVLEKHWPSVPRFGDVRECGSHNLAPVDLICGGFPCQDISSAGLKVGIDGERSRLWSEFFRIICELRPRYVLVENVSDLLVRGMGRVLGDLSSVGFDAEWEVVPACAFGAPHTRERVFIVAYPVLAGEQPQRRPRGIEGQQHRIPQAGTESRARDGFGDGQWAAEPAVGRVADGIPHQSYRINALGNAVVPQVAQWIGERILEADRVSSCVDAF